MKENLKKFYSELDKMDEKNYIESFLTYTVSPVILGCKPSCTITFTEQGKNLYNLWLRYGEDFITSIGLSYINLINNEDCIVTLIYNKNSLDMYLNNQDIKEFLNSIGYNKKYNLEEWLDSLQKRYAIYKCPHELGVFLGIPLDDVKDFMQCKNKECLLCGYWKVYNDYETAEKTFKIYDKVREYTIEEILCGAKTFNIAMNIKKDFNIT